MHLSNHDLIWRKAISDAIGAKQILEVQEKLVLSFPLFDLDTEREIGH
jgi:hypothetical protein